MLKKNCKIYAVWLLVAALLVISQSWKAWAVEHIPQYRERSHSGCHPQGIYPATVRIRNLEVSSGYSVDVCDNTQVIFYAPRVELKDGFRARSGSKFRAGTPVIDVQIIQATDPATGPAATYIFTETDARDEIARLNDSSRTDGGFYTIYGDQLVRFKLASFVSWDDLAAQRLPPLPPWAAHVLIAYINSTDPYKSGNCSGYGKDCLHAIRETYNITTQEPLLRNMNALNMYIYNSHHGGLYDTSYGHGQNNNDAPYILIDYDRISAINRAGAERPVAHEMGHAFDLSHLADESVHHTTTDSNLMAATSVDACGNWNKMFLHFDFPFTGGFSVGNWLVDFPTGTPPPSPIGFGQIKNIIYGAKPAQTTVCIDPAQLDNNGDPTFYTFTDKDNAVEYSVILDTTIPTGNSDIIDNVRNPENGNRKLGLEFDVWKDCSVPCFRKAQSTEDPEGQVETALWNAIEIVQKRGMIPWGTSLPIIP